MSTVAQDNTAGDLTGTQTTGANLAPMSLDSTPEAPTEVQDSSPAPTSEETLAPSIQPDAPAEAEEGLAPSAPETKAASSSNEDQSKAPETYDDFDLDKEMFDGDVAQSEFKALAKELGLSQQDAVTGVKFGVAMLKKLATANEESAAQAQAEQDAKVKEAVAQWQKDPGYKEKELLALKAAKHLSILDHIRSTGLNNDVVLLGALAEVGKLVSEGKALTAGSASYGSEENPYNNSPELLR